MHCPVITWCLSCIFVLIGFGAIPFAEGRDVIKATAPSDSQQRRERFDRRNSSEELEKLAHRLAAMIDVEHPGVREGFSLHYRQKRYTEALDAYRDYVVGKLCEPERFNVPARCVKLQEPKSPSCDKEMVQSPASELMCNIFSAERLKVDLGEPGAINWVFIPEVWNRSGPPLGLEGADYHHGDTPFLPRTKAWRKRPAFFARHFRLPKCFNHLLQAYAETGDVAYLDKWAAFIDDWSMHQKIDADASPYNIHLYIPHHIERFEYFLGNLTWVARRRAKFQYDIPSATLVRLLLRRLPETAAATIRNLRHFESNWRYLAAMGLIDTGILFSEFHISEDIIREGRRGMENAAVVCFLPDGSDYETTPNYWGTHFGWVARPLLDLEQEHRLDWMTPLWREELRESTWMRARAVLAHLMPNGRWPIVAPQDHRQQHSEYDRPGIRMAIPDFLDDPDTVARLNGAFKNVEPRTPGYCSEWLPYGGWYFLRGGWGRQDHFLFMKSASHMIGHGGPCTEWSNNNAVSLYAFGEELLFIHHTTPVLVDGHEQNIRWRLPYSGHMGYMLAKSVHPQPKPMRWHDSPQFAFAEGLYDGPYGEPAEHLKAWLLDRKPASNITDVTHRRQIHYVKEAGLWIITDRLNSRAEHEYAQEWHLHISEKGDYGPIYGFTKDQLHLDRKTKSVKTSNPDGPNISFYQFGTAPLHMELKAAPPNPVGVHAWTSEGRDPEFTENENYLYAFTISKIWTRWRGGGNQVLITVAFPRRTNDVELLEISEKNGSGLCGFDALTPTGQKVQYRVSLNETSSIRLGDTEVVGESLLVVTNGQGERTGILLGGKRVVINGLKSDTLGPDAQFEIDAEGNPSTIGIHRPIAPVRIRPDVNVFHQNLQITMTSANPDVDIRYTLDGSEPTLTSKKYNGGVMLTDTSVVKARAYRKGQSVEPRTLSGTDATVVSQAVFVKQEPRKAYNVAGLNPGLGYDYYEGPWQDLMLLLNQCEPMYRGVMDHLLDIRQARRDRHFAFRYSGYFKASETGVYTFFAPDPMYDPTEVNRESGYDLQVRISGLLWYPATRRHAFGTWSVALEKGLHPIEVRYLDYRGGKQDLYFANEAYRCVWEGDKPDLLVSGPGMDKQVIPGALLWHKP